MGFTAFPKLSCKYGAPMGRISANLGLCYQYDTKESLAVQGPAFEYDSGGAYWGLPSTEGPVWAVWRKGKANEGIQYVRAISRDQAKSILLKNKESI